LSYPGETKVINRVSYDLKGGDDSQTSDVMIKRLLDCGQIFELEGKNQFLSHGTSEGS
jgi:hypothetical protein